MRKTKYFSIIVNICVVFILPIFTTIVAAQMPGDATGDEKIGLDDVIYDLQVISGIRAPEPTVTGRWEATFTDGDTSGVMGLLLTQSDNRFSGTINNFEIHDGTINGTRLTGWGDADNGRFFTWTLDLIGEELHGTIQLVQGVKVTSIPVIFHRKSLMPISPYSGRPSVLSGRCENTYEPYNGGWRRVSLYFIIKWDRPVNGWDFKISGYGMSWSGNDWADRDNFAYNPDTHEYIFAVLPNIGITSAQYTFILEDESNTWSNVNWHDPYGAAAWNNPSIAYSFLFSCPPPPQ